MWLNWNTEMTGAGRTPEVGELLGVGVIEKYSDEAEETLRSDSGTEIRGEPSSGVRMGVKLRGLLRIPGR